MKRVVTSTFPSFFFTHKPSAYAYAEEHNTEVCEIYTEGGQFIGYGLYKENKLLEQNDFVSV